MVATATNPFAAAAGKKKNQQPVDEAPDIDIPTAEDAPTPAPDPTPAQPPAPQQPPSPPTPAMPPGIPTVPNAGAAGAAGPGQRNPYVAGSPDDLPDDFVIDLSNVESRAVEYIAPGKHLMFCDTVTTSTSKAGNPMLVFSFTVASGDYTGKRRSIYAALTELALWKVDEVCKAVGIENADRKPTVGEIKSQAVGRVVIGEFSDGVYNGRPSVDFSRVYAPDEVGIAAGTTLQELQRGVS